MGWSSTSIDLASGSVPADIHPEENGNLRVELRFGVPVVVGDILACGGVDFKIQSITNPGDRDETLLLVAAPAFPKPTKARERRSRASSRKQQ